MGYGLALNRTSLSASFSTNSGFTTTTNDFANTYNYDAKDRLINEKQTSQSGGNAVANATPGYDMVTGLGTPDIDNLVRNILVLQKLAA